MDEKVEWIEIELGQLCDVVRGASPRPMGDPKYFTGDIPFIKIGDITNISGKTIFDSEIHVNEEGVKKSRLLKKGSLILSNSGTVCIPKFLGIDSCIHDGFVTFNDIPDFVSQNFLFHYFHYIRPYVIQKHKQGVTQVNLNTTIVKEFKISLPPLPEQRAIVSKIEQLFSELDNGISNLKLAQEQLKVYRQAVLKAAFDGELTEEWRVKNSDQESADIILNRIIEIVKEKAQKKGKSKNNQKILGINSQNLPEIPKTWTWASVEQISSFVTDGDHNPPKRTSTGVPHLTARNIFDYKITEENCTFISEEDFEKVRKRYNPQSGDVIITCVGTIGRTAIVPENYIFSADRNLAVIRLVDSEIDSKFVQFYLNNPQAQNDMKNASGSTAQPHLYLKEIRAFPIVLPPIEEQKAIVQEIETRLSVCDKIEQDIETNLEKAEALRQSILKKAFEGKLLNERELAEVRRAEDWEPAEVLLEKIRMERTRK